MVISCEKKKALYSNSEIIKNYLSKYSINPKFSFQLANFVPIKKSQKNKESESAEVKAISLIEYTIDL